MTRWTTTATHSGEFMGIPATGRRVKVTGINIYLFQGGKAVEGWTEYNSVELLHQFGAVPSPGG